MQKEESTDIALLDTRGESFDKFQDWDGGEWVSYTPKKKKSGWSHVFKGTMKFKIILFVMVLLLVLVIAFQFNISWNDTVESTGLDDDMISHESHKDIQGNIETPKQDVTLDSSKDAPMSDVSVSDDSKSNDSKDTKNVVMDSIIPPIDPISEPNKEKVNEDAKPQDSKQVWNSIRLPEWIIPTHYNLQIEPDLKTFTFKGKVNVFITLNSTESFLVVHGSDLTLSNVSISTEYVKEAKGSNKPKRQEQQISISNPIYIPEKQYWIIKHSQALPRNLLLSMDFVGNLSDTLRGFYRSKLSDETFIATTQFEPTDARKAFPCFDEPKYKSTFNISILAPKGYHALSNMPVLKQTQVNDKTLYTFQQTKRMSTYLIAFIVSNFESVNGQTKRGTSVGVWTQKGKKHLGEYALQVAIKALEFYESTFGIDYPLAKSDLIAIPDFAAGAMENWGLITYRDTALLYDKNLSSANDKQRVAQVIAHELAHQWFGDLVTMEWWSDLWLNEGFAEFMEYKATNSAEPSWLMSQQFIFSENNRALKADASAFTHSIATNVSNPEEIQEIFDDISYGKGAAILGMLEYWLDSSIDPSYFFNGLKSYLKGHAYGNAKTLDLWTSLSTKVNVGELMTTWTDQPGFPLLVIQDQKVSQQRFYYSHSMNESVLDRLSNFVYQNSTIPRPNMKQQVWIVPFVYSTFHIDNGIIKESSKKTMILREKDSIPLLNVSSTEIVLGNAARSGVYRVLHPISTYEFFSQALVKNVSVLTPTDKSGLLSDAFALSWSGYINDVSVPLNTTRFLVHETDILVWATALRELNSLQSALILQPAYGSFEIYFLRLLRPLLGQLGWSETTKDHPNTHIRSLFRGEFLSKAIDLMDQPSIDYAMKQFESLKQNKTVQLSSDVLGVVYSTAARLGKEEDFDWLLNQYSSSTFAPQQNRILKALSSAYRPHLQVRTLDFSLSGKVRKQDIMSFITSVAVSSPMGHLYTWNWLRSNWKALIRVWDGNDYTRLNDMLQTVVSRFTIPVLAEEAEFLFIEKKMPDFFIPPRAEISVAKGLEVCKQRIEWLSRHAVKVNEWLKREL